MTIRGLDALITSTRCAVQHPMSALKGLKIGIDAALFIRKTVASGLMKESLCSVVGGYPITITTRIHQELEQLMSYDIEMVFVFNGIDKNRHEQGLHADKGLAMRRAQAWDMIEKGKVAEAHKELNLTGQFKMSDFDHLFIEILRARSIDFIVAPYSSLAQLLYLEKTGYIEAVYAPPETLCYGDIYEKQGDFDLSRIIYSLQPRDNRFYILDKGMLRSEMGNVTTEQFVDICVLSGFDLIPTNPLLEPGSGNQNQYTIRGSIEWVRHWQSGINALLNHPEDPNGKSAGFTDIFKKARTGLAYAVVLYEDGRVQPLPLKAEFPSDIHEILGTQLPEEMYFYLSRGLLGSHILNAIVSGKVTETLPADGDSPEFRRLLNDLTDIRAQCLGLICQPIARYYHHQKMIIVYWYDTAKSVDITFSNELSLYANRLASWTVEDELIKEELNSKVDLTFLLNLVYFENNAARTIEKRTDKPASVKHKLTPWGQALVTTLNALESPHNFADGVLILFECIRRGFIKLRDNMRKFHGAPSQGSSADQEYALLICRIASVLSVRHKIVPWTGPLNKNMTHFNSLVNAIHRHLRNLTEVVTVSAFMNGDVQRLGRNDVTDLAFRLPFLHPTNASMSVLLKQWFDEVAINKTDARMKIEQGFAGIIDLDAEFAKVTRLWDAIVKGLKEGERQSVVNKSIMEDFVKADVWFKERRLKLSINTEHHQLVSQHLQTQLHLFHQSFLLSSPTMTAAELQHSINASDITVELECIEPNTQPLIISNEGLSGKVKMQMPELVQEWKITSTKLWLGGAIKIGKKTSIFFDKAIWSLTEETPQSPNNYQCSFFNVIVPSRVSLEDICRTDRLLESPAYWATSKVSNTQWVEYLPSSTCRSDISIAYYLYPSITRVDMRGNSLPELPGLPLQVHYAQTRRLQAHQTEFPANYQTFDKVIRSSMPHKHSLTISVHTNAPSPIYAVIGRDVNFTFKVDGNYHIVKCLAAEISLYQVLSYRFDVGGIWQTSTRRCSTTCISDALSNPNAIPVSLYISEESVATFKLKTRHDWDIANHYYLELRTNVQREGQQRTLGKPFPKKACHLHFICNNCEKTVTGKLEIVLLNENRDPTKLLSWKKIAAFLEEKQHPSRN
ncbi:hypothetical protein NEOLI_000562 [Neolecta irregularis DAH-3]|uniref:XPG N-terminal domain-containing protein n=1 Tax=Neolecta irregularis (strain DAH-3) TaxID=1198029 RepID=A0A1U7LKH4_NEOID|nr:hypothetical protein NEOLI_000562 [Neolecta irregularis DAH-3]|eukprot:OLL23138.1 hypothetical protein NEOLI_000562 [Neolecta irregularis DAH-3]